MGNREIPLLSTYASAPAGESLCYWGSDGFLEIAVNGGRADELLGAGPGSPVQPISLTKLAGVVVMIVGVVLATYGK